ncbi:MAG: hypothetical protein KAW49_06745, partial [Anaerolineae bacterium]|nr:hypothetical protein [Anaerolineae bacterium]
EQRLGLIQAIQKSRESRLVAYVTGDRQGAPSAQIAGDAVRPMYNHVRALGFEGVPRTDLFLYSQGGAVDVPWRMVTMLREYCQELNVLVPYKAHSAATLIALGADQIVMGKKGELGPIDPILTRTEQTGQTVVQERMSVEDVMAFIAFLKERAGLGDQAALADSVSILAEKLKPWVLGSIYRIHSHIRLIARKLLTSHQETLEERQIDSIVESLAEKTYFHGHAIGREEAAEIGLPISKPGEELEGQMWKLFEAYEGLMKLDCPVDAQSAIPPGEDEHEEPVILACIESETRLDVFRGSIKFRHVRQMPPQLNLNLNLGLQLPPGLSPEQLPEAAQSIIQDMLQQLQGQIASIVQAELVKQAPIQRTEGGLFNASWQDATDEGI